MKRCSLRHLVVAIATLSVMGTIIFFIYSLSLEPSSLSSMNQLHHDHEIHLQVERQQEENPPPPVVIQPKEKDMLVIKKIARDEVTKKPKQSKPSNQMGWPDKRKGDKGRQVARVKGSWSRYKKGPFDSVTDPLNVPRVAEYCNLPGKDVHGREGEAPPGYKLKAVYVVVRHGDRSPMYRFKNSPAPVLNCMFDPSRKTDIPSYSSFVSTLKSFQHKLHSGNNFPFSLYPNSQICENSQLTGQGASQHLLIGWHLHERYVRKWRLFTEPFSPDQVYIKSTGYSRTYQSAIALLYAFLPNFNLTTLNIFRSDNTIFCSEKSFGHTCNCPALKHLKSMSESDVNAQSRNNSDLKRVRRQIAAVFNMKPQELPWLWSLIDGLMPYACHKMQLPCNKNNDCIEASVLAELWRLLDIYGAKLEKLQNYQKFTRLGIHPLLYEIKQHMLLTTKNKAKVKFALYSGHDITVTPLAVSLGIGGGKWPRLATRIVFELYMQEDKKKHHFLRILMNGEDVTSKVRFCKGTSKTGFCKLKYFVDFVQKENLSVFGGKSYEQACNGT